MKTHSSSAFHVIYVLLLVTGPVPCLAQPRSVAAGDPKTTWTRQDNIDGRWNETDVGPCLASVIGTPAGTIAKGLSVRVGDNEEGAVAYDLQTGSFRAAWTGGFLKFNAYKFGVVRTPQIDGDVAIATPSANWPQARVQYRGMLQHGRRVVLNYDVDETAVSESPWAYARESTTLFTRDIEVGPRQKTLHLAVLDGLPNVKLGKVAEHPAARVEHGGKLTAVVFIADPTQTRLATGGSALTVLFNPSATTTAGRVIYWHGTKETWPTFERLVRDHVRPQPLRNIQKPTKPVWTETIITRGVVDRTDAAFVVDSIALPFDNPYKALMFVGGHDFFSNGDIAVCTLHGDVWVVRGVDDRLEKVTWRRFATGLHQPLGLRIVDDKVFVLGRDQITRLHDRNGDGEADQYECFNNGGATSIRGHDYAACLETDAQGNFYYIRAHEGVCRVSADGRRHDSIATGIRNPIGLGVGPDGTITAAPQEGEWTPASAIIDVKPGGYYGFGGPIVTPTRPLGYDPPLCWMPREQDTSSGGQVWVTSDKWSALKGHMLHLSYGRCEAMLVLREKVNGVAQGGTVKLPIRFTSGAMRGRFNPRDGHLYVSGMRGWQTSAARDGCLQRVRYTGKPLDLPTALRVRPNGLAITFTRKLDAEYSADPGGWHVEQWNYRYSAAYGSKDYRPSAPDKVGRDEVKIKSVRMLNDQTVFLELDGLKPVMQMHVKFAIRSADGAPIRQSIYHTIHAVPDK